MGNGTTREVAGFLCEAWSESAEGEILCDVRIELAEEGIVLTEGIGRQPNGDAPAAELSGWESGRLLQLGFNAEESLQGGRSLLEQVSRFANIGTSRSSIVHFIREGELEAFCSRGGIVYLVSNATADADERADATAGMQNAADRMADGGTTGACTILPADTPRVFSLKPGEAICLASENVRTCIPLARMEEICRTRYARIMDAGKLRSASPDHHAAHAAEDAYTQKAEGAFGSGRECPHLDTHALSTNSAREIAQVVRCYGETGSIAVAVIMRLRKPREPRGLREHRGQELRSDTSKGRQL